jgi:aminoglycoside/choline kinase family phosphotransferase
MSTAFPPETTPATAPIWSDAQREADFSAWLARLAPAHGLVIDSLRSASADASFRRYLRVDGSQGSYIIMDAPPDKEDCQPFVKVAQLLHQAQVHAPEVLAWDAAHGFMLLTDLGAQTMMQVINRDNPQANQGLYLQAVDALIAWQIASTPGVLPPYDEALLRRELELFPDWYLARHRGVVVEGEVRRKSWRTTWLGPLFMCTATSCRET